MRATGEKLFEEARHSGEEHSGSREGQPGSGRRRSALEEVLIPPERGGGKKPRPSMTRGNAIVTTHLCVPIYSTITTYRSTTRWPRPADPRHPSPHPQPYLNPPSPPPSPAHNSFTAAQYLTSCALACATCALPSNLTRRTAKPFSSASAACASTVS